MPTKADGVSGLPVISWFDSPIKQSINAVFDGLNAGVEALDLFKKYRNKHFESLRAQLSSIKILGMSQAIQLSSIYSPAFVSTTIHSRLFKQDWQSAKNSPPARPTSRQSKSNPINTDDIVQADSFVESHTHVVILGGPGSGKTTLLRYLALAYADKKLFKSSELKTSLFPVFISLNIYAEKRSDVNRSLFQYMVGQLSGLTDENAEHFLKRVFERGLGIVLLDALDEVPSKNRNELQKDILDFVRLFPSCKVVLSCRTADYTGNYESFSEVEMVRLSPDAIDKIVRAWFPQQEALPNKLLKRISGDQGISNLTGTPLLLSLICIQYRNDLDLPRLKAELYKRCIDAFLRNWDAGRNFRRESRYGQLSDERKEKLFEYIAGSYFWNQVQYYFPEPELVSHIGACCERFEIPRTEAAGVLKEIEQHHGILEKYCENTFVFSHPSFQEYFAARYLVSRHSEVDAVKRYLDDANWANVLEFIVAMHHDPSEILAHMMKTSKARGIKKYPSLALRTKRLDLLYGCLIAGAAIDSSLRNKLFRHLVSSQIDICRIYQDSGVYPLARLVRDGVHHTYAYAHKRKTLHEALLPFRSLANRIRRSPTDEYADVVLETVQALPRPLPPEQQTDKTLLEMLAYYSTVFCLVIPIAKIRRKAVEDILARAAHYKKPSYIAMQANESLADLTEAKIGPS